jgi:iron complex outermembrane recepter protein
MGDKKMEQNTNTSEAALHSLITGKSIHLNYAQGKGIIRIPAFVAAVSLAIVTLSVAYESKAEDGNDRPGTALDEIVVTAQRRDELAKDVPQSITAITGDALERGAISGLEDLAQYVPGLSYNQSGGGFVGGGQVILRGITSGSDVSSAVAVYVNDIPYGSAASYVHAASFALDTASFDIERVEVLQGPQGTLYGASAFGGVVKYVLTPPSLTGLNGRLQIDGSGTDDGGANYALRGAVNIPIADNWALRLTGVRDHNAGYIDNVDSKGSLKKNWDASDTTVGRMSILGKPTDELTLHAMVFTQDIDQQGSRRVDINPATLQPTIGEFAEARSLSEPYTSTFRLYSIGADYDMKFATLTGSTGYQTSHNHSFLDFPFFTGLLGPISAAQGFPIDGTGIPQDLNNEKVTAELRLASPATQHFEWLTGLYYTHEDNKNTTSINGYLNGTYVPFNFFTFDQPTSYAEYTAYVDGTYYFTPRLDAQIGVRFTHDIQNVNQISSGLLAGPAVAASQVDDNVETYLATTRFHLDDRNMLYARIASGYRPGGPNLVLSAATGTSGGDATFKPDTLWNYEIGAKLEPAGWLTVDTSIYYIDWKDMQLQGVNSQGFGVFENAGRADSRGVEMSWVARPTRAWTVTAAAAYTDAKLGSPVRDLGASSGQRLPDVPRFSSAVATQYNFPLFESQGNVGAAWNYTGSRNMGYEGSATVPFVPLHSYSAFDLHAGTNIGRFSFNLYGKNVFNKWAILSVDTPPGSLYRAAVLRPRTIGLMITANF